MGPTPEASEIADGKSGAEHRGDVQPVYRNAAEENAVVNKRILSAGFEDRHREVERILEHVSPEELQRARETVQRAQQESGERSDGSGDAEFNRALVLAIDSLARLKTESPNKVLTELAENSAASFILLKDSPKKLDVVGQGAIGDAVWQLSLAVEYLAQLRFPEKIAEQEVAERGT